jgi:AraC-like DNA-binding protein/quercetin dioxygenase-like cupin family protein
LGWSWTRPFHEGELDVPQQGYREGATRSGHGVVRSGQSHPFPAVPQDSHYPEVDRAVVARAKEFAAATRTGAHRHPRGQLLFGLRGVMAARLGEAGWVVLPGFALWVPPRYEHDVAMHGEVSMRTAYIRAPEAARLHAAPRLLPVTPLLRATLTALAEEPARYARAGRGGQLAALVLEEVLRAPVAPLALAMPRDPRLARLARALLDDPGSPRDLDGWADEVGASRRTLTRLFRAETGLSFGAWRRRLRLVHASERTAAGEVPARAAARVGYRSLGAFRAMTRRELGGLPDPRRRPDSD